MKITKETIKALDINEQIQDKTDDKNYVQRIRNYVQQLKSETHDYTVIYRKGVVTVTRIDDTTRLLDVLNAMKPGEVIHPAPSTRYRNVHAVCSYINKDQFRVTTVTQVEKLF